MGLDLSKDRDTFPIHTKCYNEKVCDRYLNEVFCTENPEKTRKARIYHCRRCMKFYATIFQDEENGNLRRQKTYHNERMATSSLMNMFI